MILALWLGLATATELRGFVVPTFAFDTDDGVGGGVMVQLARPSPTLQPYQWSIAGQISATLGGFQYHRIRWDQLGIGPGGRGRLLLRAGYKAWAHDGYWGEGSRTAELPLCEDSALPQARCVPRSYYQYGLRQPFVSGAWRQSLGDRSPWSAFGGLALRLTEVDAHGLLAEEAPEGVNGGLGLPITAGVLYDSREPEIAPQGGILVEAAAAVSPPIDQGLWGGPHLGLSTYVPLGERVVWAHRTMGEWLFGAVPFNEMVGWIGYDPPTPGFGGANTLRGLRYGRWRGPGKVVVDQELRIAVFHHEGKHILGGELAPYLDLGAVSGHADKPVGPPVHGAVGLGLRLILDETFVIRVDSGYGADVIDCPGCAPLHPTLGVYIAADHPF